MSVQEEWTLIEKSKRKERNKQQLKTITSYSTSTCSFSAVPSSALSSSCSTDSYIPSYLSENKAKIKKGQNHNIQKFLTMVEQTIFNLGQLEYCRTLTKLKSHFETHFGNIEGRSKKVATCKDEQENILVCNCQTVRHRLSVCVLSLVARKGQKSKSLLCTTFNNQIESEEVYKQGPLMDLDPQRKIEPSTTTAKEEENEEKAPIGPTSSKISFFSMKFISFNYLSKFPNLPKVLSEMLSCPFIIKIWASDSVPWELVRNLFGGSPTSTNIFISASTLLDCFSREPVKDKEEKLVLGSPDQLPKQQKFSIPIANVISRYFVKPIKAGETPDKAAFEHSLLLHYLAVSLKATSDTWPPISTKSIQNFQMFKLRTSLHAFLEP